MRDNISVEVGRNILYARRQARWSQSEVERRCGLPKARISRYENGHVLPSVRTLVLLAATFNVPIMDMLDGLD